MADKWFIYSFLRENGTVGFDYGAIPKNETTETLLEKISNRANSKQIDFYNENWDNFFKEIIENSRMANGVRATPEDIECCLDEAKSYIKSAERKIEDLKNAQKWGKVSIKGSSIIITDEDNYKSTVFELEINRIKVTETEHGKETEYNHSEYTLEKSLKIFDYELGE